jgi:NADPH-dependent 2,4-dienoyl-CoA reductase/sulfur reductase-like enzyme
VSTRYIIIGMGVAGISAAEGVRSLGPSGEITVIGDDPHGYYSRPGLAYVLTGELEPGHLFPYPPADLKRLEARFVRGQVTEVRAGERSISLASGSKLSYDRLLIATGARAVRLEVPGAALGGVVKLDDLEDTNCILTRAKKTREAVVVGGGITALELVEGLAARRIRVHYLLRGDRYWGAVLDEAESRLVEARLRDEGIHIHYHSEIKEIIGKDGRVTGVQLADGNELRCQILAYAIGIVPRLDLARSAGVAVDRGILTDEFLETNIPGVFAAGDAAQVRDPITGRQVLDSLWNPARQQGFTAGQNMAGARVPYVKEIPFNVTRLAGLTTTLIGTVGTGRDEDVVGIVRGESETWHETPEAAITGSSSGLNRVRLLVGQEKILGAVVMGDQGPSRALEGLIRGRVDISPIRQRLLEANAPIGAILTAFWADRAGRSVPASAN